MSSILQKFVLWFPIPLTKKESIKRNIHKIIKNVCTPDSCCVDIGSYGGTVLKIMIEVLPKATHMAFEPLPKMYTLLVRKYSSAVQIQKIAICNETGDATFYHAQENPAFSGLRKVKYPHRYHLEKLEVKSDTLDNQLKDIHTPLINIDVNGAEFSVIKGAIETINRCQPVILFVFESTGAEAFNISAEMIFDYFTKQLAYHLYTLKSFAGGKKSISRVEFVRFYNEGTQDHFVAAPKNSAKRTRNV